MVNQIENLKKKAVSGAVLLGIKRIFIQIIYTLSNIALARLLFPADFGTFAIATFVVMFFTVFSDLGLGPSLVQKKERLDQKDLQTAFTTHLILSSAIVLLIFLAAPLVSGFYNLGQTGVNLFRLYSAYLLFLPFKTVSGAVLERNLEYQKLVKIEVLQIFTSSATTVFAAFLGLGVFSFAVGAVFGHFVGTILYFLVSPWKLRFLIYKKNLFSLAKFGLPFQSSVILGLFYGPLILLYLGKVVGASNLGFYQFAAGLSALPMAISEIVNRIVFPLGARTQKDRAFFRQIIERSIMIVSSTSLPIVAIMIAAAPSIIHLLYTDRWLPILPAFYLGLAQMGIISFTGIFTQLLLSLGFAKTLRNIGIFWAILTWILAPPLIHYFNFVGMSLTGLLISATGIWLFFRLRRDINFAFWPNFTKFFIMSTIAGLVTFILIRNWEPSFPKLFFALIFGSGIYVILVYFVAKKALIENFKLIF